MKTTQHVRRFFPSLLLVIACIGMSCKQVSQAIDNLLTFDIERSNEIPITPTVPPEGFLFTLPGIPIPVDSAELAKNKTATGLVKTLKLTKLVFTPDDPLYPMTNIDTIRVAAGTDSLSAKLLGTYSGKMNMVMLTGTDFSDVIKKPNGKFFLTFQVKKSPSHDIKIKTDYTLTFTADPF